MLDIDINNKEQFINDLNLYIKEAIANDLAITSKIFNNVRYIKIDESKRMCGGTHLATTKDIISCTVNKVKVSKINKENIEVIEATIYYSII